MLGALEKSENHEFLAALEFEQRDLLNKQSSIFFPKCHVFFHSSVTEKASRCGRLFNIQFNVRGVIVMDLPLFFNKILFREEFAAKFISRLNSKLSF